MSCYSIDDGKLILFCHNLSDMQRFLWYCVSWTIACVEIFYNLVLINLLGYCDCLYAHDLHEHVLFKSLLAIERLASTWICFVCEEKYWLLIGHITSSAQRWFWYEVSNFIMLLKIDYYDALDLVASDIHHLALVWQLVTTLLFPQRDTRISQSLRDVGDLTAQWLHHWCSVNQEQRIRGWHSGSLNAQHIKVEARCRSHVSSNSISTSAGSTPN